jgi:NAD-dependent dihydropyrimidine dehydrogenase PreA subunit
MARDGDLEKKRRAGAHPDRPGEQCHATPGSWTPVVDHARCEAKGDCVVVCPNDVFEVGRIASEDFAGIRLLAKLKVVAHGRKTAYTTRADSCRACGLCVVACPEHAISLLAPH